MILSKKIRLKPTKEQEKMLYKSAGTARFIYNWALNKQEENFKLGNKFISDNDLRKEITLLKKSELIWLNEVSNNVAKQAVKDLVKAYLSFFKIQKKGQKYTKETLIKCKKKKRKPELRDLNGYPKFKSKKKSKLSFYNDCVKLKFKTNLVLIEKVGWVKCNENLVNQKFTNPRVSFDGKYWYLSVGIEQTKEKEELNDKEQYWIGYYNTYPNQYNMTPGGQFNAGECHPSHKLTEKDVIDIRTRYKNHERKKDVYLLYAHLIGESGFHKIWNGSTWKTIMPEVYTKENKDFHAHNTSNVGSKNGRSKLTEEDVKNIRLRKKNGEQLSSVYNDYSDKLTYKSFENVWSYRNWKKIIV